MSEKSINDCWNTIGVWGDQSPRCERLDELIHCHNCEIYSNAGHQLLGRKTGDDYLIEWEKNLCIPREENTGKTRSALIFRMGDEWFAIATQFVKEITHCDKHHSLPHRTNRVLRGIVNVHGELLLNVSLGYLFKVNKREDLEKQTNERYVVIDDGDECFAFPVTDAREIIHYESNDILPSPSTIKNDTSCFLRGILRYKNMDIGILDTDLVFTALHKNI